MMKRVLLIWVFALLGVGALSAQDRLQVVATTTILADVAQNVAGDLLDVSALVPADADTHAFEPSAEDVARVAQSDLLLAVGAGYEEFLGGLLENAGEGVTLVEVSNGIYILPYGEEHEHEHEGEEHADEAPDPAATPEAEHSEEHADEHEHEGEYLGVLGDELECEVGHEHEGEAKALRLRPVMHGEGEEHEHEHGSCDPHVWMNPDNVMLWADNIAAAFAGLDPANADAYRANAEAYKAQLEALHEEIGALVETLPEERRVLVTNHEFMGYFADAFGFEVAATVLPGGSTAAELDPQGMAALIELVQMEGVPAIFAEVSANPQLAEVIAQEAGIDVVTALYSESLGGADSPAPTYIEMMRYNAATIVGALQ
jgi:ABC-type Zn uptake system ZnuABC Zn-binding protein ZnuA